MTNLVSEDWVTEFDWREVADRVGEESDSTTEKAPSLPSGVEFSVYGALLFVQVSWILFLGYVLQTTV